MLCFSLLFQILKQSNFFIPVIKEWRNKNKNLDGNIRDHATINELICLANLENLNSVFINDGLNQSERLVRLNKIAISQMKILNETDIKYLNSK